MPRRAMSLQGMGTRLISGGGVWFWKGGRGWVAVEGDGTVFSWRKDIGRVMGNEGWGGKGIGEQEGAIL